MTDAPAAHGGAPGPGDPAGRLTVFNAFGEAEWAEWLDRFLNGERADPPLYLGHREPHVALVGLCDRLSLDAAGRFGRGVALAFQATPVEPRYGPRLHSLLHVLAYARPLAAKGVLRQRLYEGALAGLAHGGQELDALAVLANGKYEADGRLCDYVERRAPSASFGFRIAAVRALSFRGDDRAARFLWHFIRDLEDGVHARVLSGILPGVVDRTGFAPFQRWYHAESPRLWAEFPGGARPLAEVLAAVCDPHEHRDAHARLLRAEIASRYGLLPWEALEQVIDTRRQVDESVVVGVLSRIYSESRVFGIPWDVPPLRPEHRSSVFRNPKRVKRYVYVGDVHEGRPVTPEVELVLLKAAPDSPAAWSDLENATSSLVH